MIWYIYHDHLIIHGLMRRLGGVLCPLPIVLLVRVYSCLVASSHFYLTYCTFIVINWTRNVLFLSIFLRIVASCLVYSASLCFFFFFFCSFVYSRLFFLVGLFVGLAFIEYLTS